MIILTAEEAAQVRGYSPYTKSAALDPVPLKDGTFMLSEAVESDPAHKDVWDLLAKLPHVELDVAKVYDGGDPRDSAELMSRTLPDYKLATRKLSFTTKLANLLRIK